MITPVNPESVPASPFYSQGVEATGASRTVYVSGQVGVRTDGTIAEGIAEQAKLAFANLVAVLTAADMGVADIAKATIYLTDAANLGAFMEATGGALPDPPPATTLLIVSQLADPSLLVEIEATAVQ